MNTSTSTDNREKIRIAYILPTNVRGGVEEHVLSLIKGINKQNFETFLVASPQLLQLLAPDLDPHDTNVFPLQIKSLFDFKNMIRFFIFLRNNRIDLVNTHMFIATFYYAPWARLAGVPKILETTHLIEKWRLDKGFLRRNSFIIDKLFYKLVDKILAVSNSCKTDLENIKKIPSEKINVVHNGRDLTNFDPTRNNRRKELRKKSHINDDDFVFGIFARLNHQKGHKYLLNAVKILKERGISSKFILVGDGELQPELMQQSKILDIEENIFFAGYQEDIPGYLSMVDAVILPSLFEGLPLCLIEALSMEKPVIATAVDGTPEIIIPKKTGTLVPPKDSLALSEAIIFALNNHENLRSMGKNGREFVCKHFSIEKQIQQTEILYDQLCA